jgi:hypothetical protein
MWKHAIWQKTTKKTINQSINQSKIVERTKLVLVKTLTWMDD